MRVMRLLPALFGALVVTLLVFLFMHNLIQRGREDGVPVMVYNDVQVVHLQSAEPPPEKPVPEVESRPQDEPAMEALTVAALSPAAPMPATPVAADTLEIPALDLGVGDIHIVAAGKHWNGPLGGGGTGVAADGTDVVVGGTDAQGYIEVVPFDTRRPNVPEVAWRNKIDGWVLVAFSVTPEGRTRDVRVLDASPRGIFEETVMAAVEDWRYRINFSGDLKGDVVLTQKVEVLWQNYPQNLPNVD